MNKKILYGILVVIILLGAFMLVKRSKSDNQSDGGHKNATYLIDGSAVKLVEGNSSVEAAPGSASKITTQYFGNDVSGDFNGDGDEDIAFLLTQTTGGSGVFYYLVAALNTGAEYQGTNAILLGDRIAPQTVEFKESEIVVNYADRAAGDAMAATPSVGVSKYFKVTDGKLVPVVKSAAAPTLDSKAWTWVSALFNDERELKPRVPGSFAISFGSDGRFTLKSDCNSVAGSYIAQDSCLAFDQIISTKKACQDSQETEFIKLLSDTGGYHFGPQGELILDLKFDSGSVVFK